MRVKQTYLIGEIGQNHNGSVEIAKLLVDMAATQVRDELFGHDLKGMDAVKLTKRDLTAELAESVMNRPYNTPHSFGRTYGEHRKALELSDEEHWEVYRHAKSLGLEFIETLCAPGCLSLLRYFTPDKLKVASRDLTNIPLLQVLAETGIPLILSTGMSGKEDLDRAIEIISKQHSRISVLHCVSQYPTHPENVNLNSIPFLLKNYPQFTIGYSDHTIGISVPVAAVALGAEIIEKHITLDRTMKGTDQAGSLGKDGVRRMVRDIRLLEMSLGTEEVFEDPSVQSVKIKLERSLATNKNLGAGHVITENDLQLLSPGDGFKWKDRHEVIGRTLVKTLSRNEIIYPLHLQ